MHTDGGTVDSLPVDDRDKPTPEWKLPAEPLTHRAARRGELETLQALLAAGADINETADLEFDNGSHLKGLTTLMVAARSLDGATAETLRWLVEHGADVNACSEAGSTAAWYAAGHGGRWGFHKKETTPGHVERLRYLLDQGLEPNECMSNGRSLVTEACEAGDPARVRLLIDRGAAITPKPEPQTKPRLLDRIDAMFDNQFAARRSNQPRGEAASFQIPLFCAARSGSGECVVLVLKAGADPNMRDSSGGTALMYAGSIEVVRVLLNAGADLHAVDEYGKDAFSSVTEESCGGGACGAERFEVARSLIEAGVDIEKIDPYGKTRLASAAFGHHADTVEFLLKIGAKPGALDAEGGTPLHSICWQGEYQDEDPNCACERNRDCERIIRLLVQAGVNVNARNSQGGTPLHEAASGDWGNATAIRTLLELGAESDPATGNGVTPLMLAAMSGEVECIHLLLLAGADPRRTDHQGRTAVDCAREHLQMWQQIVAEGPDKSSVEMDLKIRHEAELEIGWSPSEDAPDFSVLLAEKQNRHQDSLREAQEALKMLEDAGTAAPSA